MKTICPWGMYEILKTDPLFQVKCITVNPGHKTSLQSHQYRSEHWIIISGTATITQGDKTIQMQPQDSIFTKSLEKHRIANDGPLPLILIEVQTGSYFGEDDITRFEDVYGR